MAFPLCASPALAPRFTTLSIFPTSWVTTLSAHIWDSTPSCVQWAWVLADISPVWPHCASAATVLRRVRSSSCSRIRFPFPLVLVLFFCQCCVVRSLRALGSSFPLRCAFPFYSLLRLAARHDAVPVFIPKHNTVHTTKHIQRVCAAGAHA